jgi:transcription elongation GreA/GreB family factor
MEKSKIDKNKHYLTQARYSAYLKEIEYMEGEGAKLLAKLLASSPGSGMGRPLDLPAHQMAREYQGHLQETRAIVKSAVIIDDLRDEVEDLEEVAIGCTVAIRYEDNGVEEYTILGRHEVNIEQGRISFRSPVGSALLGSHKGDTVLIRPEVRVVIEKVRRLSLNFDYPSTGWKKRLECALVTFS